MLLKKGDRVQIRHLHVAGVCSRLTRDESGDVAAEIAYVSRSGIVQKIVLAANLLQTWNGGTWAQVTGVTK